MKQRSSIFSKSIAAKFMLMNTLICMVFILIAVVTVLSFDHIDDLLTKNATDEINRAIHNAQTGRDLGRIVSDTTLLESRFFGKKDLLEAEGKRLIEKITALETRTSDPRLKKSLGVYRRKLQRVLEQCAVVNGLYREIQSIQQQLTTFLASLEEIISNKMVAQVLQGEDITVIEQLGIIVAGYRETLFQINIRFLELDLAYFESPTTKQENPVFPLLDYLFLRLRPLSASEPEIAEYGLRIMADVMNYRKAVSRFHQVACELRTRLDEVYLEKEGILFLMGEMDSRFAETTAYIRGSITKSIGNSSRFIIILSGAVILLLGIVTFSFVASNIRKPMAAILRGIEAIGSGDLDAKIRLSRRDEWRIIEKALNNMASDRKHDEEQIRSSLKEKEILLGEIHHRVKNNMQIISSLLKLQSSKINDEKQVDIFKNAENRIRTMSLIHETLYQSKDFANVDFNGYVKSISNYLLRSYIVISGAIKLNLEIEDITLGLDHAIPCGLIINELVSNSLKHAFPKGREGEIKIALRTINDHEVELTVSDDGVGIPREIDMGNPETLGLELVQILAENQLDGTLELERDGGTEFRIRFGKIQPL